MDAPRSLMFCFVAMMDECTIVGEALKTDAIATALVTLLPALRLPHFAELLQPVHHTL
jgi:hypothetical protein